MKFSLYAACLYIASCSFLVSAQVVVNGQVFTTALAIVDSPQPNTPFHAGSPLPFAVDVSGNGKLSQAAFLPDSGLSTSYQLLEIYLVSKQFNLTVSQGPGLLTQEPGSTVKHLNWPVPKCITPGAYNLTVYETSTIEGQNFFSLTPIPVEIQNTAQDGACTADVNLVQDQPQPSNPPLENPWLKVPPLDPSPKISSPASSSVPVINVASSGAGYSPTGVITLSADPSEVVWPLTLIPPGFSQSITIDPSPPSVPSPSDNIATHDPSEGSSQILSKDSSSSSSSCSPSEPISRVTVMVTPTETPVTVVFVSVETVMVPTTLPGDTVVVTSLRTVVSSATAYVVDKNGDSSDKRFLPINEGTPRTNIALSTVWSAILSTTLAIFCA